jgi:pimeloyl-ACP methyl ester carboxylesterase
VLESAGVERADVLGYSLGGIVAQQLAVRYPERVRRLVLVATSCGFGGVPGSFGPMLNIATPFRYWSKPFYSRTIGNLVGGRARWDAEWVSRHGELRQRQPPTARGYLGQVASALTYSSLPSLRHIRQPTLVVTGDDDPLMPSANAVMLAHRIPDARLLVAPGEGHLLLLDRESAIFEPVAEYLAADSLSDARAWRDADLVTGDDVRAAIAATRRQAQPWGSAGALMRTVWPADAR